MPYFKDRSNRLHFLEDSNFQHLLPPGSVQISDVEAEDILASQGPSDEELSSQIRAQRAQLLAASDWTVLSDAALSSAQKTAWKAYRKALRDVTEQPGFPKSVEWPVQP